MFSTTGHAQPNHVPGAEIDSQHPGSDSDASTWSEYHSSEYDLSDSSLVNDAQDDDAELRMLDSAHGNTSPNMDMSLREQQKKSVKILKDVPVSKLKEQFSNTKQEPKPDKQELLRRGSVTSETIQKIATTFSESQEGADDNSLEEGPSKRDMDVRRKSIARGQDWKCPSFSM